MVVQRQSNIELCRLISILLVMLVHTTGQSLGHDVSFGVHLLEGFSIIGVNVFILITGYFSASPKKTSLVNIAFICFFWMLVKVVCRYCIGEELNYKHAFFITSSNWFIPSYIALLFVAPILNSFCNSVSKKVLWGGVMALLLIEMWFDWLPPFPAVKLGSQNGYSVFSFMVLYLMARAIRLYDLPRWFKKASPLIYIVCSVILAVVAHTFVHSGHLEIDRFRFWFAYTNPLVILSSVAFLMMFEQLHVQSKFINHIAKSTLACLLGHTAVFFLYTKQFRYLYDHFDGLLIVGYWVLAIMIVFVTSVLVDQLRLLLWRPMNNWLKNHIKTDLIFR